MMYVVEMGSGTMIYIPSFIKAGLGIETLMWGTHRKHDDFISLLLFFQNKERRVKNPNFLTFSLAKCWVRDHVLNLQTEEVILCCLIRAIIHLRLYEQL
jgi:hypothetical protein